MKSIRKNNFILFVLLGSLRVLSSSAFAAENSAPSPAPAPAATAAPKTEESKSEAGWGVTTLLVQTERENIGGGIGAGIGGHSIVREPELGSLSKAIGLAGIGLVPFITGTGEISTAILSSNSRGCQFLLLELGASANGSFSYTTERKGYNDPPIQAQFTVAPFAKTGLFCDLPGNANFLSIGPIIKGAIKVSSTDTRSFFNINAGGNISLSRGPLVASVSGSAPIVDTGIGNSADFDILVAARVKSVYAGGSIMTSTRTDKSPLDYSRTVPAASMQLVVGGAF